MIGLALAIQSVACQSATEPSAPKSGTAEAQAPTPVPAEPASPKAAPKGDVAALLSTYERMRDALSRDDVGAVGPQASALAKSADAAKASAPEAWRPHLASLAAAARTLSTTAKDDADAVRRAFGEVSKYLVALLTLEPSLRAGLHLFKCPMAQGYQKWVQPSDKLQNPYMGSKMVTCGSAVDW